jgi:hypothetical protein
LGAAVVSSCFALGQQFLDGEQVAAVHAGPASAESAAEQVAVGAALLAKEPGLTLRALVDNLGPAWALGDGGCQVMVPVLAGVAAPEGDHLAGARTEEGAP